MIQDAFLTIATPNLDRLVAFYGALLQRSPAPYQPQRYAEFRVGGLRLALFYPKADHRQELQAAPAGALSLCLEVVDLDAAIAQLTELGYPPPGAVITASHGREIYAYDPDGNRVIVHQGPAA